MPLQNRADPFGQLHSVSMRGLFTGNRGVIHDPDTRALIGRRWTTKAWIICACDFKGRRREVMGRNGPNRSAGWTELFFLDEAAALAAGHRPCFYCRRANAVAFRDAFARGNGMSSPSAPQIDSILHRERRLSARGAPAVVATGDLPDGAMVEIDGAVLARRDGKWLEWRFEGYRPAARTVPARAAAITPLSTLAALHAGYRPVWHGSA